jgi:hypothetical protein
MLIATRKRRQKVEIRLPTRFTWETFRNPKAQITPQTIQIESLGPGTDILFFQNVAIVKKL